jgi:hypothetical protein
MTANDILIRDFQKQILHCNETISFLVRLGDAPQGVFVLHLADLTFEVASMESLHIARTWLKEKLGRWTDNRANTWYSGGRMLTEYIGKEDPIRIWICTKPEDFPKELQSNKCKVVKLPDSIESNYAYICDQEVLNDD